MDVTEEIAHNLLFSDIPFEFFPHFYKVCSGMYVKFIYSEKAAKFFAKVVLKLLNM